MDNNKSSVAAALSAASEEDRSEAKNMISPMSTSCAPSNRKRPFDALEEGSGNKNDTTVATACNDMSITETNEPSSSIEALLKDMQHKMNCMQTEIDTTKAENIEMKSKYYELENKMEDISLLKDEQNEDSFDDNERMHDMQTEIDGLRDENNELKIQVKDLGDQNEDLNEKCDELEIDVKDLILKNEYNEWSYNAEDIPASYWIERGFSEQYAERIVEFLGIMKEYTHQLRKGGQIESIDLLSTNDHMLHDDILLPHWKEFTDALQQYQKFEYRENYGINFEIDNIQLQQEVINMLTPALKTTKVKNLVLGSIGSNALPFAEGIMQSNPHLKQFGWRNNQIESVDDMRRLCKSINNSMYFFQFGLTQAFDGNNPEMMQFVLGATNYNMIKRLFLNNNGIGTVGAQLIANFLASNPRLECLFLKDNHLNDTDAILLANSLQSNTNLEWMYLDDNNSITTVGRQALLESVFNVSTLNSCAASNYRCCIHGLNPDISNINGFNLPSTNKIMKIFTILSATDESFFNMNCLGDLSYKLIPDVLSLSHKFGGRTPELSEAYFGQTGQRSADWSRLNEVTVQITSMFELLRGWAVPSLSA